MKPLFAQPAYRKRFAETHPKLWALLRHSRGRPFGDVILDVTHHRYVHFVRVTWDEHNARITDVLHWLHEQGHVPAFYITLYKNRDETAGAIFCFKEEELALAVHCRLRWN